jgi:hypothetical protein
LFRKKSSGGGRGFFVLLRVVLEDALFLRGVFVVRLWWIRGGLWSIDDRSVAAKNMPTFEIFLWSFLVFGNFNR